MRKIIINGATNGLGKALVKHFSDKDDELICIGKNKKKMQVLIDETIKKHSYFSGDLLIDKNLKILISKLSKLKKIDAVIHCMGGGLGLKDDLISKSDFLKLFNTNLFVQSEINNFLIKKSINEKRRLKIIHISSIASIENVASVGYSTVKAALNVYSNILSKKFITKNIDVKNIILGAFETKDNSFARLRKKNIKAYKEFKNKRMPLKRYNTVEEISPVIDFILDKDSNVISGDIIIDNKEKNSFRN